MKSFYYSSDKKIFQNKLAAIKHYQDTNNKIFFHYHDDVYSKIDWTLNPPGTLEFHYRQQAERIRDEYDYVVLFYSGGYDSTNILETFYYNNIKLDKIVCVGAFKQDEFSGADSNHNGEIYKNCFPNIMDMGMQNITQLCDYSDLFGDPKNFSVYDLGNQWVEEIGPWFSPHNWFWRDIHKHVIPNNMQDRRVALIWGKDKPRIINVDGKPGFQFTDVSALSYAGEISVGNIDRINFYWDPAYPWLVVKQAHEYVLRGVKNPDDLYHLKRPILYKSPKSPTNLLSLRDKFLLQHTNSSIYDLYLSGISRIRNTYNINTNPPHIYSRFYPIVA